jgi:hypothetical protein
MWGAEPMPECPSLRSLPFALAYATYSSSVLAGKSLRTNRVLGVVLISPR